MKKIIKMLNYIVIIFVFIFSLEVMSDGGHETQGDTGNAENILKYSKQLILIYLSRLDDEEWDDIKSKMPKPIFPNGDKTYLTLSKVKREFLANLIDNIKMSFNKKGSLVNGTEGIMDWGKDADGTIYIEALRIFYIQMGGEWDEKKVNAESRYIVTAMLKILKEASHVWGYSDSQGLEFGSNIVGKIQESMPYFERSYSVPLVNAFRVKRVNPNYLPKHAVKVRKLGGGNYEFSECNVGQTSISCNSPFSPNEGFSTVERKEHEDASRLITNRYLNGSSKFALVLGVRVAALAAGGACFVGGMYAGGELAGLAGLWSGGLIGLGCSAGIHYYSEKEVVDGLIQSGKYQYDLKEFMDIENLSVDDQIYLFFHEKKSIDEVIDQLVLHIDRWDARAW